ncbi:hypothetical protein PF003_g9219 [Phytophthora fragariae]|nr:hypothetical protein PF003_g9219 [Phytophthora fragariae]
MGTDSPALFSPSSSMVSSSLSTTALARKNLVVEIPLSFAVWTPAQVEKSDTDSVELSPTSQHQ